MKPHAQSSPLLDDLRALPRPFWVLLGGTFINRFGTFVMPFLTIYLSKRGFSLTTASYAVSGFGLGALLGSTVGGWMADYAGRRNTIVIGTFAAAVFYLLLYYAVSLPQIVLCAMLAGLSGGFYPPASNALLADVVPEPLRVRAFSALRVALNAGFACGAATAGFLAKYSYFWLFAGDALTTLAFGLIALFALPHGLRSQKERAPWSEALAHIGHNRAFRTMFFAALCAALVFSQFGSTYSAYVTALELSLDLGSLHIAGEAMFGMLIGWNGVMVTFLELPFTSLTQRFDPRRVMALGYVLLGGGFAMNAMAHTVGWLFVAMTVFTIGEMISIPVSSAYVAQLTPEEMRGRYMGVFSLNWSLAAILGPQLGFRLLGAYPAAVWLGCGLLGLLGAALLLRMRAQPIAEVPGSLAGSSNPAALPVSG